MSASKCLSSIETVLQVYITDHTFCVDENSPSTEGFQSKNAFGMTNKTKFGERKMVNGSGTRAESKGLWESKGAWT
jgi:hypothetical protein